MSALCAFYCYICSKSAAVPYLRFHCAGHLVEADQGLGTLSQYRRSVANPHVNIVASADAGQSQNSTKFSLLKTVFCDIKDESLFQLMSCVSHRSCIPVRSKPFLVRLAVNEAPYELILLCSTMEPILGIKIKSLELGDVQHLSKL